MAAPVFGCARDVDCHRNGCATKLAAPHGGCPTKADFHIRGRPTFWLPHKSGLKSPARLRYQGRFGKERIVERSLEAAEKVRQTLRYRRFAGEERKQTLEEDAIREACGEDAQRLDREMHAERRQWRPYWDVLVRHDTLLSEEKREREDQRQRERLQKWAERPPTTRNRDRGDSGRTM